MTEKPTLDLLRSMTDAQVLALVLEEERITRADIAVRTGISKTTISESMRRLGALGVVLDTGERTTGRGRAGSYYALAPGRGSALVAGITSGGVVVEVVDPRGAVLARHEVALARGAAVGRSAADALQRAAAEVRNAADGPLLVTVVSAADPVDRHTSRLVHLPDAPFLVGDLDPVAILQPCVDGTVVVDNDVNWAARAERVEGSAVGVDDFVYVYLGEGLGAAVVSDGDVRRGGSGLAGELAHLVVPGRGGRAVAFTEVFAQLGLRRAGSTAIDVDAVTAVLGERSGDNRRVLADAVGAVVQAAVGLSDPEMVVVGGPWGGSEAFVEALRESGSRRSRTVQLVAAGVTREADLVGARLHAVEALRAAIVAGAQPSP